MATFGKPENALKRAEELINVNQKAAALQQLHDLITSRRHRTWQKPLENIMMKYVELCVDMRKGRFAKEGLIQYRIVCQQVNVASLEEVIKYFMKLATERVEQAQSKIQDAVVTLDVDDLEAEKTPEDLMLTFVSGDSSKDRSDRELVTPWFKFLWETYRTVLEILRNNSKLESLYAMTAMRAFQFCLHYKRATEFRRLCEMLRNHLANLNKYRDQRDRPDLTLPDTLNHYLEIRLEQLKVATELELWQEAFRSVEDIHGLMTMVKKTPKPQIMAVYYAKLIKIFWMSESHLYHAYAWYKLYALQKLYNKNLNPKDLMLMANSVLLAIISVPPYDRKHGAHHFELELEKDRNIRMAGLLGFSLDPKRDGRELLSRSALLSEIISKGLLAYVSQEVKDLYNTLENEFHPLDLAAKVQPLLSKLPSLSEKLSSASPVPEVRAEQYIPALENLATLRVLQQASQVYQTMRITNLSTMIPFFDFPVVEKLAVDAQKFNFLQMKVDCLNGVVHFGSQDLESEKVKNHLTLLAKRLSKAVTLIHPPNVDAPPKRQQPFSDLVAIVEKDHKKLLARKVIIEKRKEDHERRLLRQEQEEANKKHVMQTEHLKSEAARLVKESEQRTQERMRKEMEQKEMEDALKILTDSRGSGKSKKKAPLPEISSKEEALNQYRNEQLSKVQEAERKLLKLAKSMDYLERAKREVERPLLEEAYLKRQEDDRVFFEQQAQREIEQSRAQHETDIQEKNRMKKMVDAKEKYQAVIRERREEEFEELSRIRRERREEAQQLRREEIVRRRKMEFYRRQEEARLIEEARLREEAEARQRAEDERRKEEAERKRQADLARLTVRREPIPAPAAVAPAAVAPAAASDGSGVGTGTKYVPPRARGVSSRDEPPPPGRYTPRFGREEGPPARYPSRDDGPPPPRFGGGFGGDRGGYGGGRDDRGDRGDFGGDRGGFGGGRDDRDRDRDSFGRDRERPAPPPGGAGAPDARPGAYRPPVGRTGNEPPPPAQRPVRSRW